MPLLVVGNDGNTLLGRDWFQPLGIEVIALDSVNTVGSNIVSRYQDVLGSTFPGAKLPELHIELYEDAKPKFLKSRSVPFALKEQVCTELDRLEQQGILERVDYSRWATPVVVVRKKYGTLRICGDYRSIVNQAVRNNVYPLTTTNELFAQLGKGRVFIKLHE